MVKSLLSHDEGKVYHITMLKKLNGLNPPLYFSDLHIGRLDVATVKAANTGSQIGQTLENMEVVWKGTIPEIPSKGSTPTEYSIIGQAILGVLKEREVVVGLRSFSLHFTDFILTADTSFNLVQC